MKAKQYACSLLKYGSIYLTICMLIGTYLACIVALIYFSYSNVENSNAECWANTDSPTAYASYTNPGDQNITREF